MKRVQQGEVVAGGFGGGAQVLVGVLGAGQEEAAQGGAVVGGSRPPAQLGFQWRAFVGGRGDELLDQLAVGGAGRIAQSVPVKSLWESGR